MVRESALEFDCAGSRLVGVLAQGNEGAGAARTGLGTVIVVGGPQYRAGSHRQFVLLARAMAAAGVPTLRFDCRGMGDSEGEPRSFEEFDADIASAIDALQEAAPGTRRVVLCGLCDGASASLLYLQRRGQDPRVAGLILINPWVRTAAGQAETRVRHYYRERLLSGAFWSKLFSGRVASGALAEACAALRTALSARRTKAAPGAVAPLHYTDRMADGCLNFRGQLLLVLSGQDYTAKEFLMACANDGRWQQVLAQPSTRRVDLDDADHTFSSSVHARALEQRCAQWLADLAGSLHGEAAHPMAVTDPDRRQM
jgi:exosortase A-associated hydrolase 1